MGKKTKPKDPGPTVAIEEEEDVAPEVIDGVEGFWQEFGPSFEHLSASKAIVVLTLDRATGKVDVDDIASTPMETWAMIATLQTKLDQRLDVVNGLELD